MFTDSALMATVPDAIRASMEDRWGEWLPDATHTTLLYRGSRDGMTPKAFHVACDGKGPTVTLIRSMNGYTFGAYTAQPWQNCAGYVECEHTFLFSVEGPFCSALKFPLLPGQASIAIDCNPGSGPRFGEIPDLGLLCESELPDGEFDEWCVAGVGRTYEDVAGHGLKTFTGTRLFTPREVEVFSLTA